MLQGLQCELVKTFYVIADNVQQRVRLLRTSKVHTKLLINLEQLTKQNMLNIYNTLPNPKTHYSSRSKLKELRNCDEFWIITNDNQEILAFAAIILNYIADSEILNFVSKKLIWIYELQCVLQGIGLGSEILRTFKQYYKNQEFGLCCQPHNIKALKFYAKHGFITMYKCEDFEELFCYNSNF